MSIGDVTSLDSVLNVQSQPEVKTSAVTRKTVARKSNKKSNSSNSDEFNRTEAERTLTLSSTTFDKLIIESKLGKYKKFGMSEQAFLLSVLDDLLESQFKTNERLRKATDLREANEELTERTAQFREFEKKYGNNPKVFTKAYVAEYQQNVDRLVALGAGQKKSRKRRR